jgi:hypothetical protein
VLQWPKPKKKSRTKHTRSRGHNCVSSLARQREITRWLSHTYSHSGGRVNQKFPRKQSRFGPFEFHTTGEKHPLSLTRTNEHTQSVYIGHHNTEKMKKHMKFIHLILQQTKSVTKSIVSYTTCIYYILHQILHIGFY